MIKIYFSQLGVETSRDTTQANLVVGNNLVDTIQAYFTDRDMTSYVKTITVKRPDNTTTNELVMNSSADGTYASITLQNTVITMAGTYNFTIRLKTASNGSYITQCTSLFSLTFANAAVPSDETNITTAEYDAMIEALTLESAARVAGDEEKVDKKTTEGLFAYTHNGSTEGEIEITSTPSANKIAKYDSNNNLVSGTPISDNAVVIKSYVETNFLPTYVLSSTSYNLSELYNEIGSSNKKFALFIGVEIYLFTLSKISESTYGYVCIAKNGYKSDSVAGSTTLSEIISAISVWAEKSYVDSNFYNKTQIDTLLNLKANKIYVDSNFYNKTQADNLLLEKADKDCLHLDSLSAPLTSDQIEYCKRDNAKILYNDVYWEKYKNQSDYIIFTISDVDFIDKSTYWKIAKPFIYVEKTSGSLTYYSESQNYLEVYDRYQVYNKNETYNKSEVDTLFASALVYQGSKTVAEINSFDTSTLKIGYFYNITNAGVIVLGNIEVFAGDNIAWTGMGWDKLTMDLSVYDDKFIAAGFFEVQAYNENTGEISFVYASNLYTMSYNSSTGVLTIEAE